MASTGTILSSLSTPPLKPQSFITHTKSAKHTYIPSPVLSSPPFSPLEVSLSKERDTQSETHQIHEIVTSVQPDLEKEGSLVVDLLNPQGNVRVSKPHNKNIAWNSLLKVKPQSAGIEELSFCEPVFKDGFLQIDDEICEMGAKEWEDMIVGYFVDKKLPYSLVKSTVEKRWKLVGQVEILLDGDLFYFSFNKPEDRDYVLDEGSFHMLGKLFIIRPWTRSVEEDRGQVSSIPLWVNFYKVPKFLWTPKGLSLIASAVGKPICADKNTEAKKMLTFARICIEVDATKELPHSIPIKTSSKSCIIDVKYVWKPLICTECKGFGHGTNKCGSQAEIAQPRQQAQGWPNAKSNETRREQLPIKEPMQIETQGVNDGNYGKNVRQTTTKNGGGKESKENTFVLKKGAKMNIFDGAFELPTKNTFAALQEENEFSIQTETEMVLESNEGVEGFDTTSSKVHEIVDQENVTEVEEGEIETTVSKEKRNQTHFTPESDCPPGFENLSKQQHLAKMSEAANSLMGVESEVNQEFFVKFLVVPLAKKLGLTGMSVEGQQKLFGELLKSNNQNLV